MKCLVTIVLMTLGSAHAFIAGSSSIVPSSCDKIGNTCLRLITDVDQNKKTRRAALAKGMGFVGVVATRFADNAVALDMDAFMNAELESDEKNCDPKRDPKCKPKLSQDEALCQYGQGAKAKEACKRVKVAGGDATQKGGGKSLGGAYAM